MCDQNTSEYQHHVPAVVPHIKLNTTYSHIKDTAGVRYGTGVHLAVLTGAENMTPVWRGAEFIGQTMMH